MVNRTGKGIGYLLILIIICGLAGGVLGELLGQNVKVLSFLKNYITIGMVKPVQLDLRLASLTFGFNISLNILSLFGMIGGFFIYKKM